MFPLWKIDWRGSCIDRESEKSAAVERERMMGTWAKTAATEYIVGGRIQKSDVLHKCMVM